MNLYKFYHPGSDHFVSVSSIGCSPGLEILYDSLYHDVISQEVEEAMHDLLGGNLIQLKHVKTWLKPNLHKIQKIVITRKDLV